MQGSLKIMKLVGVKFHEMWKLKKLECKFDENPKTTQIQGPMTRSRTKQSVDTLQQMVTSILSKA